MLLTITCTGEHASDLSFLLYKNPYRPQAFELNCGRALVFYPEITESRVTAALLLNMNPVDLARGKVGSQAGGLFDYVNDRPYVSSSFMSTAISRVFGTAMSGRADSRQALADSPLPLEAHVAMLPCRGDRAMVSKIFEPLGYSVAVQNYISDENFPAWGESDYLDLTLRGSVRLQDLLRHLYVLIPVFDRQKHYWVGEAEVEKLLRMGEGWLPSHPEKAFITSRYLSRKHRLVNAALQRLAPESDESDGLPGSKTPDSEETLEKGLNLNTQRLGAVLAALKNAGAHSVIDMGCGDGKLLALLLKDGDFTRLSGMDVSHAELEHAAERLNMDHNPDRYGERLKLFQSSLCYRDARFSGFDAACAMEVVEHMDPNRLGAFERVLFECARPQTVILTTPNIEYNIKYPNLKSHLRHGDHRFEWTRAEFRAWAENAAAKFGYTVNFAGIGDNDAALGSPTQMGVFTKCA